MTVSSLEWMIHPRVLRYASRSVTNIRVRGLASQTLSPVKLDYNSYAPSNGNGTQGALIILHGLFGSKRNWTTLSKALMQRLNRPIYALDLRNHGTSPHAEPMTYEAMAQDVWHLIKREGLTDVSLIGHSMGGKVAMAMALGSGNNDPSRSLSNLIVADVAPVKTPISPQFIEYIDAMKNIEDAGLKSRKEASDALALYEKDPTVRAFLLTNLLPFDRDQPRARFTVPLSVFKTAVPAIGDFPFVPGERTWGGNSLIIKGSKSAYINRHNTPLIDQFFPNRRLEVLEAGHWVHAERPQEFTNLVCNFVRPL